MLSELLQKLKKGSTLISLEFENSCNEKLTLTIDCNLDTFTADELATFGRQIYENFPPSLPDNETSFLNVASLLHLHQILGLEVILKSVCINKCLTVIYDPIRWKSFTWVPEGPRRYRPF